MGLSISNLNGLRVFPPSSILNKDMEFLEFLRYETKSLRSETVLTKDDLFSELLKSTKIKNISKIKKSEIKKLFDDFAKNLDKTLLIKNLPDEISDIKWKRIDIFCNLLRLIERSDERKVRWALYHLFANGKQKISKEELSELLKDFKIKNLDKILTKIIKAETLSGFDAEYDGKNFQIKHDKNDKLVLHYLADAIEEQSRRSPGELEEEILDLIDEGSYSNQEISQALLIDEGLVSRTVGKLRDQEKIVLSSFGKRGARYFTTNCDNCPFGTTKASCRKEAISYITTAFNQDFGLELTANDFDNVETNQVLLKIKRIVMMARKEKDTKLERNLGENLENLLSKTVDRFVEVEIASEINHLVQNASKTYYKNIDRSKLKVILISARNGILHEVGEDLGQFALKSLRRDGIQVLVNTKATDAGEDFIVIDDKARTEIKCGTLIWAGGVKVDPLVASLRCEHDSSGRIIVDEYLRVKNQENVYALGDCAYMIDKIKKIPYPPTAQIALRAGKITAKNIINQIIQGDSTQLETFTYHNKGIMATIGKRNAVALIDNKKIHGIIAWILWRFFYLSNLPTREKKIRVALEWFLDIFFKHSEILTVGTIKHKLVDEEPTQNTHQNEPL